MIKKKMAIILAVGLAVGCLGGADTGVWAAASKIALTSDNFKDKTFLGALKSYDANGNGYLESSEINNIKVIENDSYRFRGVCDFEGIQYLTGLVDLEIDGEDSPVTNTSLDLSKNKKLREVSIENCRKLTKLTVGKAKNLRKLECENNGLKELDLSQCTALEELDCSKNVLTSLNVKGCKKLKELDCSNNKLTKLDLGTCAALRELDCKGNHFKSVDVSKCTGIDDVEADSGVKVVGHHKDNGHGHK